jgi:hypothetical protein
MTADDFQARCTALINRLLTRGFVRPIAFAAIGSDGLTTDGSSETVSGVISPWVKTDAKRGVLALYLLPFHLMFVDLQGHTAQGVLDPPGADVPRESSHQECATNSVSADDHHGL